MSRRSAGILALLVLAVLLPPGAGPASAVGPSIALNVSPPRVEATPSLTEDAPANFSGVVDLFTNPVGAATITVEIASSLGWRVTPPGFSWRATEPSKFTFDFTVAVPPNATAGRSDSVTVTASYRLGGVTVQTESMSVSAVAGEYYAGSARRITPPAVMDVGKQYVVEFEVKNDGNARATFAYVWADAAAVAKTRASLVLPQSSSLGGFANETVQFFVTGGSSTPAGKYSVPVRVELKDRSLQVIAAFNFTLELEFTNLPIYQGILPQFDLRGPYTFAAFAGVFLGLWFLGQVILSIPAARRADPAAGPRLPLAVAARIRGSRLVRGVGRAASVLWRGRGSRKAPTRPEDLRRRVPTKTPPGR